MSVHDLYINYMVTLRQVDNPVSIEQKDRVEGGLWCVRTEGPPDDTHPNYTDVWVKAETAPHAICLAALRAKGVEL